jgi:spermidine synthase
VADPALSRQHVDSFSRYVLEQHNRDFGFYVRASEPLLAMRTRYQQLEIVEASLFGRMLSLDGAFMTSEKDEFFYHESVVHVPAMAHPRPTQALVIGGGDGGAAEELLKHNTIERLVMAELDEGVVEASRRFLPAVHNGVFENPRLDLRITDGKTYVETTRERFDLIVLDLTDPVGPSQALYTREFYADCKRILNQGGLLSMPAENPLTRPQTFNRIIETLACVFTIVRPYLVYIPLWGTWWALAVASDTTDPITCEEEEVERRITARGVKQLSFYNGAIHRAVFALPNFVRQLLAQRAEIITAASPADDADAKLNTTQNLVIQEQRTF